MVWEKVWLEVAWAIRRVGDRVGGQSTENNWNQQFLIDYSASWAEQGQL